MLLAYISQAYQQLEKWNEAGNSITESLKILKNHANNSTSNEELQIQVLANRVQGDLLVHKKEKNKAIESYKSAFKILKDYSEQTSPFRKSNQFITAKDIELVHRDFIELLSKNNTESELRKDVEASLTKHLYAQLKYSLKAKDWKAADQQTAQLMLNLAKREEQGYLDYDDINNFSCPHLKEINKLWVESDKRFGFSVQKEIWIKTGNRLAIKPSDWKQDYDNYFSFAKTVGWYDDKKVDEQGSRGNFLRYDDLMERIKDNPYWGRGSLPLVRGLVMVDDFLGRELFFRLATCKV
ncbi:GUN4 domain-containing protein [Brasilonema sp. CT11]|nr:GUN4 domain-containing protein [Brasilonema sp. CT11]